MAADIELLTTELGTEFHAQFHIAMWRQKHRHQTPNGAHARHRKAGIDSGQFLGHHVGDGHDLGHIHAPGFPGEESSVEAKVDQNLLEKRLYQCMFLPILVDLLPDGHVAFLAPRPDRPPHV
jgi:hypothetical protein